METLNLYPQLPEGNPVPPLPSQVQLKFSILLMSLNLSSMNRNERNKVLKKKQGGGGQGRGWQVRVEEREAAVKEGGEAEGRGEAMPNPKQRQKSEKDWSRKKSQRRGPAGTTENGKGDSRGFSTNGFLCIWRNELLFKVKENKNKKRGGEKEEEREGLREEGRKRSWQTAEHEIAMANRNLWWQTRRAQPPGEWRIGMSCFHNASPGSDC